MTQSAYSGRDGDGASNLQPTFLGKKTLQVHHHSKPSSHKELLHCTVQMPSLSSKFERSSWKCTRPNVTWSQTSPICLVLHMPFVRDFSHITTVIFLRCEMEKRHLGTITEVTRGRSWACKLKSSIFSLNRTGGRSGYYIWEKRWFGVWWSSGFGSTILLPRPHPRPHGPATEHGSSTGRIC